jgi:hypothetical protein
MGGFNLTQSIDGRPRTGSRAHTAQLAKSVAYVAGLGIQHHVFLVCSCCQHLGAVGADQALQSSQLLSSFETTNLVSLQAQGMNHATNSAG